MAVIPSGIPQVPSLRQDPSTPSTPAEAPPMSHSLSSYPSFLPPPPPPLSPNPLDSGLFPAPGQGLSLRRTPALVFHSRASSASRQLRPALKPRPSPSEGPPPTARIHLPRAPHPSPHFLALTPLTRIRLLVLFPTSAPLKHTPSPPQRGLRSLTWRRVVQLAVVGPPAGAGRLPDEERARHGGRS